MDHRRSIIFGWIFIGIFCYSHALGVKALTGNCLPIGPPRMIKNGALRATRVKRPLRSTLRIRKNRRISGWRGTGAVRRWPHLFRDYALRHAVLDSNPVGQLAQDLAPLHQDIVISSRLVGTTALSLDDGPPLSEAAPLSF